MSSSLKDIQILIAENLFERAEKRLIEYLVENPQDPQAIEYLALVEKQLYIQKRLEVSIPTRVKAEEDLKRFLDIEENVNERTSQEWRAWLREAPTAALVDVTVMMGASGLQKIWSEILEQNELSSIKDCVRAEVYAWTAYFLLDAQQAVPARQWIEKALMLVGRGSDETQKKLWKGLRILHGRCLWEMGERGAAVTELQGLFKEFPKDHEIRWLIERYGREL